MMASSLALSSGETSGSMVSIFLPKVANCSAMGPTLAMAASADAGSVMDSMTAARSFWSLAICLAAASGPSMVAGVSVGVLDWVSSGLQDGRMMRSEAARMAVDDVVFMFGRRTDLALHHSARF